MHLSLYIDGGLCLDIDAQAAKMAAEVKIAVTRTDMIRLALTEWLEQRARTTKVKTNG